MYVDACAIIALASDEPEAERVSAALMAAKKRITSPVAMLEAAMALARPDKFNRPIAEVEPFLMDLLDERGIELRDLPPAKRAVSLSLHAADKYGRGANRLNLGDCLHYASAKYYRVPILATHDEFRQTDLETIP
ncbi:type II toxin-antitoxin system VapC family toxin [Shinella sumterensis]|jgi:ribonuclease VapC|uniref:Ribonuclease VapC n=1 Tax=Shinella sumterensis TaxID=1967501 RepID=A0AA50HBX9_9HYPH|nr:type II toxin-antitoxin system VapC family toxin [Shinella sumterensis]WLS01360.1 type II toxin-antitoxin system VapC family toxin [Shinella sumterensis]